MSTVTCEAGREARSRREAPARSIRDPRHAFTESTVRTRKPKRSQVWIDAWFFTYVESRTEVRSRRAARSERKCAPTARPSPLSDTRGSLRNLSSQASLSVRNVSFAQPTSLPPRSTAANSPRESATHSSKTPGR